LKVGRLKVGEWKAVVRGAWCVKRGRAETTRAGGDARPSQEGDEGD
jgi:hypothetical protein